MIHSPTHLSNHTPRRKACWMFWGLFSHQRIKILKSLHFFWDFVPPQKESCHLIFPFCISPHFPYVQPTVWYTFPSQRLSPLQPCAFRHPFQCCLLALPSSSCEVGQVLVQMSAGSAYTWSSVRSTFHKSESCLLLSLFTLFIQKLFL